MVASQVDRAALDELARRGLPLIAGGSEETEGDLAPDEQVYGSDWFTSLPEPAQKELRRARSDAGKYRNNFKTLRSKVDEWGGEETVTEAVSLRKQLDTEQGSWQVVGQAVNALRAAGFNDSDVAKQLGMTVAEVRESREETDEEDDKPVTTKQLQSLLENYFEQRQERTDEETRTRMGHVVNNYLTMQGVTDRAARRWIANSADDYWREQGSVLTEHAIITSLEKAMKGFDEFKSSLGGSKKKERSEDDGDDEDERDEDDEEAPWSLPKALTGSSPAGGSSPHNPSNSAEAGQLARRLLSRKGG